MDFANKGLQLILKKVVSLWWQSWESPRNGEGDEAGKDVSL